MHAARWLSLMAGLGLVGAIAGCQGALFPEDAPRSPYERYQTLRGQPRPPASFGGLGADGAVLRDRLQPIDRP